MANLCNYLEEEHMSPCTQKPLLDNDSCMFEITAAVNAPMKMLVISSRELARNCK